MSKRLVYLRPYQGMPYAWETALPSGVCHELVVEVEGSSPLLMGSYQLDRVGEHAPIVKGGQIILFASVRCDGPTLTLTIIDAKLHPQSNAAQLCTRMQAVGPRVGHVVKSKQASSQDVGSRGINFARGNWLAQAQVELDIMMVGLGVSVVESEKQREVLYVWLGAEPSVAFSDKQEGDSRSHGAGLSLSLWRRRNEDGLALAITCIQVDNLTPSAACPVVVCRSPGSRVCVTSDRAADHTLALTLAKTSFSGSPIQVRQKVFSQFLKFRYAIVDCDLE